MRWWRTSIRSSPSEVELQFTARPGGAPANVAVAAAKLGAQASFVGRLGNGLAPEDIRRESLLGASFANFGSIPLIKDPVRSATRKFAQLAIDMDVAVAFDVNLREHLWNSFDEFRETVEPVLGLAAVIKLSADELPPVLGTADPEEAAGMLLSRGAALVLVSMGPQGAYYATQTFDGSAPSFQPERVLDATGAGDAFLAATLAHLAETPRWRDDKASVHEAVRRGTAAGAMACAEFGAMPGLPTRDQLDEFIAAHMQSTVDKAPSRPRCADPAV